MQASEQMGTAPAEPPKNLGPTFSDWLFIFMMIVMLAVVVWVGRINYNEGMKTEQAKENADHWVKWLANAAAERSKPGFSPAACAAASARHGATPAATDAAAASTAAASAAASGAASVPAPAAAATVAAAPTTWGPCMAALTAADGPLGGLRNAFTGALPIMAQKCDPADKSLAGAIVIEKLVPSPPGSAIPIVISPLVETDPIDQKIQLRVSACDGGAYPGKPTEVEF